MDQAIANGNHLVVTYVYRPFNKAVDGVKSRFDETGRIVTPDYMAYTHVNALENIVRLSKEYSDNKLVSVEVFDNSKEDKLKPISIEKLKSLSYIKPEETIEQAQQRLERYANGKLKSSLEEIRSTKERAKSINNQSDGRTESSSGSDQSQSENGDQTLKQSANPTYSSVEKLISEKMGGSASPDQIKGMLRDMKPEELQWLGVDDFLKGKKKVTKEEMLEHIRANMLENIS